MKTATLEDLVTVWSTAPAERRIAAINALRDVTPHADPEATSVIRWTALAKKLSVTKRTIRSAVYAAGIQPVVLPGRNRAIGIRTRDLALLEGGSI